MVSSERPICPNSNLFIGLLSGTSMDAIDAAIVDLSHNNVKIIETHSEPWPTKFRNRCLEIGTQGNCHLDEFGMLDAEAGKIFAEASLKLLKKAKLSKNDIRAIGSHGQTLRHGPRFPFPFSLQIGNPHVIAEMTKIMTVFDFRRRDIAVGGEGAPLAPGFHAVFFRDPLEDRAVINIGGISNITILPANFKQCILGFDVGPGNCLMDAWVEKHWHQTYDQNGEFAKKGKIITPLLEKCLADPYFDKKLPKSTGREYFNLDWLQHKINASHSLASIPEDVQRTLLALTVESLVLAIEDHASSTKQIFICGGGASNPFLMQELQNKLSPRKVTTTTELGIHADWVESALFAWLAKQTLEGLPGNCPSVTGANKSVPLGAVIKV